MHGGLGRLFLGLLSMIRAIVTDLDGTVLCHGNGCVTIPESFIVAYRHLTEVLNIPIYPATGRSLHSAEGVLKGVQVDDLVKMKPGVYNDGRLIFTSNTPMPAIGTSSPSSPITVLQTEAYMHTTTHTDSLGTQCAESVAHRYRESLVEMAFDRKLAKATHEWLRASLGVMSGLWGFSVMARDGQMAFQDAGSFPHQNRLVDEWHEKSFRVNELDDIRDKYESEILEFTLVGEPDALDKIQAHFDETFPHADRACMKGPKGMWLKHISLHSQPHSPHTHDRPVQARLDLSNTLSVQVKIRQRVSRSCAVS